MEVFNDVLIHLFSKIQTSEMYSQDTIYKMNKYTDTIYTIQKYIKVKCSY